MICLEQLEFCPEFFAYPLLIIFVRTADDIFWS